MTTHDTAPHTAGTARKHRGLLNPARAAARIRTGTPRAGTPSVPGPEAVLGPQAQPLTDLDRVGRMIGEARVVGMGEASHSAHEFFTLKQRLFAHLVTHKSFTTFALETSWSTGLRLNAYVQHGIGDPERIMEQEFQGQYVFWNTEEYLDLIRWMRHHNISHPGDPQLRFAGIDLGYPGPEAFTQVVDYAAACRPGLAHRIEELYSGLRPAEGTQAGPWMRGQLTHDPARRREQAESAREALHLLYDEGRPGPDHGGARSYDWAVQNATAITQTFTAYAFPDEDFAQRMRYRDRVMAANTAWLLRRQHGGTLLAAHNSHVAYTSDNPRQFPQPAGGVLRELLGSDYVNIGMTFNRGTVNALPDLAAQEPRTYTVVPAPDGHNDHVLDQVAAGPGFALDLRTAGPAAHTWLNRPRPTRSCGLYWPPDDPDVALGRSYDILVHLHEVEAARLR